LLAKIALEDTDQDVRKAAVWKITDPTLLVKIAVEGRSGYIHRDVVREITDPTLLAQIAVEGQDARVRRAAVEKITHVWSVAGPALLAKVALGGGDADVRRAVIWNIRDQTLLAKIASEDKDANVRHAATRKLSELISIAKIALEDAEAGRAVEQRSRPIIEAIKKSDIATLAEYIHPVHGVRFSTDTVVDPTHDLVVKKDELVHLFQSDRIWSTHTIGESDDLIKVTFAGYFREYIHEPFIRSEDDDEPCGGPNAFDLTSDYANPVVIGSGGCPAAYLIFEKYQGVWYLSGFGYGVYGI